MVKRATTNRWSIYAVLPNIALGDTLQRKYIAVSRNDDPIVTELISSDTRLKRLVTHFTDNFGHPQRTSVVLISRAAPSSVNLSAVLAFRNILSLNHVMGGWMYAIRNERDRAVYYSDYFDLYPVVPHKSPKYLLTLSPAVHGLDLARYFRGQTSPWLPHGDSLDAICDKALLAGMLDLWDRAFTRATGLNKMERTFFRSLEMAFHASRVPISHQGTLYDYGTAAALWIGAFEILSHPPRANANLRTVMDILKNVVWRSKRTGYRRFVVTYRGAKLKSSLVQKLYAELYYARNDFLHGNPVSLKTLYPFRRKSLTHLLACAPLIYYFFISTRLRLQQPVKDGSIGLKGLNTQVDFEDALLKACGKRRLNQKLRDLILSSRILRPGTKAMPVK